MLYEVVLRSEASPYCRSALYLVFMLTSKQVRNKWRYNWRLCSRWETTASSLNRLAVCKPLLWWCALLGCVWGCVQCLWGMNACCFPVYSSVCTSSDFGAFSCVSYFFFLSVCVSVCVCSCVSFWVCVCPWCAASKAWRVALTGLSSIRGSALGLKLGGRREEGRWRHTHTHRHVVYST